MQVQHNIGLDFASGVRTLMRQDPDIIMVGEIRDLETAEMAIQAALTGHLVLSTLHTNDAPSAITRLLDLGVPPYLINATLLGVLAQRLVRTLCPHCKEREALSTSEAWNPWSRRGRPRRRPAVNAPKGCLECRMTGYLGRIGHVRNAAHVARRCASSSQAGLRCRPAARAGLQGRHEAAAHQRRAESGGGHDHHRGSAARHAAPG